MTPTPPSALERWRERCLESLARTASDQSALTEHCSWCEVEMATRFDCASTAEAEAAMRSLILVHEERLKTIATALAWLREELEKDHA